MKKIRELLKEVLTEQKKFTEDDFYWFTPSKDGYMGIAMSPTLRNFVRNKSKSEMLAFAKSTNELASYLHNLHIDYATSNPTHDKKPLVIDGDDYGIKQIVISSKDFKRL